MFKKIRFTGMAVAILSTVLLAACGTSKAPSGSSAPAAATPPAGGTAKPTAKLVMATNATFPPFEFVDTSSGAKQFSGLDIDIIKQIAKNLGFEFTITDMPFASVVGSLKDGRADFAISGMSPTEERKKNVDFSIDYFKPRNAIVYLKGANYKTMNDLEGKKIIVPFGTTYEKDAKTIKGANVVAIDGSTAVIQEVKSKRGDAAMIDGSEAHEFLKKNPELEMSLLPPTEDSFAIAFPKGSKWVEPFNNELKKMQENGQMKELVKKWLGDQFAQ
ncbi:hypothetical protein SD70_22700 [Gordoniibacillus kamchatkensis]|uniref:ABC transporter substrate-binding protein n=1 Tax=Gordoniibacillus kamchatkensis TaxID=1590651 RepID=A0ABR5ADH2_9BACL|nr:transporter substrate-binding domain-containing protein [Paenibacillus sp. VKM B-2647]KIL39036.1 hypothetical protein SD70_22700 [Paenibacillus sp. VKM B-2647]